MSKMQKLARDINAAFTAKLHAALAKEFPGLKVETEFNIISMALVTTPIGKKKFTRKEFDFIRTYEAGYSAAKEQVC